MNRLEEIIRSTIETDGPMSIADYMMLCLTHPEHGYYTTGMPVGGRANADREGGDFITAPEISQMFGELIGVWCMEVWQALGKPKPFNLVEIGPGRGTLMRDLLRVSKAMPDFLESMSVQLIEVSPTLAEQQSLTLSDRPTPIKWIGDITALPDAPSIIIANELLDALPFRQWVKTEDKWCERAVGLIENKLTFCTRPNALPKDELPADHASQQEGTVFETAPAREALIATIADHLVLQNGAALFIDYGHTKSRYGDTFQALRAHEKTSPLKQQGQADLTNHVDFMPLVVLAKQAGCIVPAPTTQGEFLLNLGLLERAGNLGSGRNDHVQENLRQAVERLAGPQQMGELFKVMAFGAPASLDERWPGFSR